jgi:hypothetical protein
MDKAQPRRIYPYVIAGAILLVGLGISVGIYLTAGLEPDDLPWEFTPQSKKYTHALKLYGGTTNALLVELNDWFSGLWHGKPLAFTVAAISLGVALVYLFFATQGPLTERNEDLRHPGKPIRHAGTGRGHRPRGR